MSALVTVRALTVRYGGVVALDAVDLELEQGSIEGLIGPNGSGKSTFLAALSGARRADDGEIIIDGEDRRRLATWRVARLGVARSFQGTRLIRGLSVRENITLGAEWHAELRGKERSLVDAALERTGLAAVASADARSLAYGTQRLVEIARAIAAQPRLLLLDEPAAGMNPHEKREVETVMKSLRDDGVTQLLVEHDMDMIAALCDRVRVLSSGRLIATGTAEEVSRDPEVREAYLGHK
ncbi:ABC transporter ATP-binding protein [Microbacterium sp.]|uniref:ABC transporter ATP-binding protein n=1 Tax=Microbacterium sp. TaxID=51671 RepID=UPI0039E351CF